MRERTRTVVIRDRKSGNDLSRTYTISLPDSLEEATELLGDYGALEVLTAEIERRERQRARWAAETDFALANQVVNSNTKYGA